AVDSCCHVVRHFDPTACDHFRHQFPYADLDDGRAPVAKHGELAGVDIHADHVVTIASETSEGHRPHITQAEDADPHRLTPPLVVNSLASVLSQWFAPLAQRGDHRWSDVRTALTRGPAGLQCRRLRSSCS